MANYGNENGPIGIIDSGVGGFTVMRQLVEIMPNENIVYYADTLNSPYGDKTKAEIIEYTVNAALFLYKKNIKALVIACNTASIYAYKEIKKLLDIPVIEIISPSYEAVAKFIGRNNIGVMATKATIDSKVYRDLIEKHNPLAKTFSFPCPLLVPLIENTKIDKKEAYELVSYYLRYIFDMKVDILFLACTHYPIIKNIIKDVVEDDVQIIDPSFAIAMHIFANLKKYKLLSSHAKKAKNIIYFSGEEKKLKI